VASHWGPRVARRQVDVGRMVDRNNIPVLAFFRTHGFIGEPYLQLARVETEGNDR